MKKSKRSKPQGGGDDRLSELPDSLIFHIIWFVPMVDVVKTSVLSKRWRNLWTSAPFLNFDGQMYLRNLVNQSFFRWNGERILKLRLYCNGYKCARAAELESWVMFAKDKGVEELYLHGCWYESNPVPRCLYSCSSSLKELSINAWRLQIDRNVEWNQLKGLTITGGIDVDEDAVNKILCGSPKLKVFNLSFVGGRSQKLNIRSNSLKELFCKYIRGRGDLSFVELRIWAPKLESLKIEGIPWGKLLLENVSSLTRAALGFSGLHFFEEEEDDGCRFCRIKLENGFLWFRDFLVDNFIQLLQLFKQVDSVALCYCCPKALGAMKWRCIGSSFPNVKSLTIQNRFNDYDQFLGLLEIFPQLNRLVIQDNEHYHIQSDTGSHLKFKPNNPKSSFLLQLRTVSITWSEGDTIFPFVEFLLKYASKLEKIVFRVEETSSSTLNPLALASQKLLIMPRFSQNCKIVIL